MLFSIRFVLFTTPLEFKIFNTYSGFDFGSFAVAATPAANLS